MSFAFVVIGFRPLLVFVVGVRIWCAVLGDRTLLHPQDREILLGRNLTIFGQ
jgi:hypothetical protein